MLISRLDPAAKGSDLEDVLIKSLETLKENKDSGEKIQNTKDYGTTAIGITGITKAYRKYQKRERQEIFERGKPLSAQCSLLVLATLTGDCVH